MHSFLYNKYPYIFVGLVGFNNEDLGYSLLIFILTVFMATSGVVTSPSLFNTTASNNLEKVFATTDNEQQQQQFCIEGGVFNEVTQTCQPIDEENEQGTDADEDHLTS